MARAPMCAPTLWASTNGNGEWILHSKALCEIQNLALEYGDVSLYETSWPWLELVLKKVSWDK